MNRYNVKNKYNILLQELADNGKCPPPKRNKCTGRYDKNVCMKCWDFFVRVQIKINNQGDDK